MALQRPQSRPGVETPSERIFRKTMRRQMTKAERRWLQPKPNATSERRKRI